MKDRIPLYPGRVTLTPVSGQPNTFDLVRADQPTQEGTPLNKATLLKDATAALFGLGASAVPDDVLTVLSRFHNGLGNEYVWAKSDDTGIVGYVNSPDHNAYPPAVSDGYTYMELGQLGNKVQIATGSYVGTGTWGPDNPNVLTFSFNVKLLILWISGFSGSESIPRYVFTDSLTEEYTKVNFDKGGTEKRYNVMKKTGTSIFWHLEGDTGNQYTNAEIQLNYKNPNHPSGQEYTYVAFG